MRVSWLLVCHLCFLALCSVTCFSNMFHTYYCCMLLLGTAICLLNGTVSCQVAPVFPLFNANGPRGPPSDLESLELQSLGSVGTGYTHRFIHSLTTPTESQSCLIVVICDAVSTCKNQDTINGTAYVSHRLIRSLLPPWCHILYSQADWCKKMRQLFI